MDKNGPIVLIDDDEDDLKLLIEIFADMNLRNEIHLFRNPSSLITFLQRPDVDPFIIISDISMPVMSGHELRRKLSEDPAVSKKKIPYLFFSAIAGMQSNDNDVSASNQGSFRKPSRKSEWRNILETIVRYWTLNVGQ